jgi:hypothetical protein
MWTPGDDADRVNGPRRSQAIWTSSLTMRGGAEPDEEPVQPAKLGDGRWPTN